MYGQKTIARVNSEVAMGILSLVSFSRGYFYLVSLVAQPPDSRREPG